MGMGDGVNVGVNVAVLVGVSVAVGTVVFAGEPPDGGFSIVDSYNSAKGSQVMLQYGFHFLMIIFHLQSIS